MRYFSSSTRIHTVLIAIAIIPGVGQEEKEGDKKWGTYLITDFLYIVLSSQAFSKVVQKLVPELPTLENLLNIYIAVSRFMWSWCTANTWVWSILCTIKYIERHITMHLRWIVWLYFKMYMWLEKWHAPWTFYWWVIPFITHNFLHSIHDQSDFLAQCLSICSALEFIIVIIIGCFICLSSHCRTRGLRRHSCLMWSAKSMWPLTGTVKPLSSSTNVDKDECLFWPSILGTF